MKTTEEVCVTQVVKEKESRLVVQTMKIIHLIIPPHQLNCRLQTSFTQLREAVMLEDQEKPVIKYFMEVVT